MITASEAFQITMQTDTYVSSLLLSIEPKIKSMAASGFTFIEYKLPHSGLAQSLRAYLEHYQYKVKTIDDERIEISWNIET